MKTFYTTENYPFFVCHDGNWGIWSNARGHCAAIPTPKGKKKGCLASHFGDMRYVAQVKSIKAF